MAAPIGNQGDPGPNASVKNNPDPAKAQTTLNSETWFGLTPNLANAAANARAQRVDRILIGRRLGSLCEDPADELEKDGSSIEQGAIQSAARLNYSPTVSKGNSHRQATANSDK
jgi:hypothetical protein